MRVIFVAIFLQIATSAFLEGYNVTNEYVVEFKDSIDIVDVARKDNVIYVVGNGNDQGYNESFVSASDGSFTDWTQNIPEPFGAMQFIAVEEDTVVVGGKTGLVYLNRYTGEIRKTISPTSLGSCKYSADEDSFPIIFQSGRYSNGQLLVSGICNCKDQSNGLMFECMAFAARVKSDDSFYLIQEVHRDYIDSFSGTLNLGLVTDIYPMKNGTIYFAQAWNPTTHTRYHVSKIIRASKLVLHHVHSLLDNDVRPAMPSCKFLPDDGDIYLHVGNHLLSDDDFFDSAVMLPRLGSEVAMKVDVVGGEVWMLEGNFGERTVLRSASTDGNVLSTNDLTSSVTYPAGMLFFDNDDTIAVFAQKLPSRKTFTTRVIGISGDSPTNPVAACDADYWGKGCDGECKCSSVAKCRSGKFGDGVCDCGRNFYGDSCAACDCREENGVCNSGKSGDGQCFACDYESHGELCDKPCDCTEGRTCMNLPHNSTTAGCLLLNMASFKVVNDDSDNGYKANPVIVLLAVGFLFTVIGVGLCCLREACAKVDFEEERRPLMDPEQFDEPADPNNWEEIRRQEAEAAEREKEVKETEERDKERKEEFEQEVSKIYGSLLGGSQTEEPDLRAFAKNYPTATVVVEKILGGPKDFISFHELLASMEQFDVNLNKKQAQEIYNEIDRTMKQDIENKKKEPQWEPLPELDSSNGDLAQEEFKFDADYDEVIPNDAAKRKFARELEDSMKEIAPQVQVANVKPGSIIALVRGPSSQLTLVRESVTTSDITLPSFGKLLFVIPEVVKEESSEELADKEVVDLQENSGMEDVIAENMQNQTKEELEGLKDKDLVNPNSIAGMESALAQKLQKQKMDNQAEEAERKELEELRKKDSVNPDSQKAMQDMLAGKLQKQKIDNQAEDAKQDELKDLENQDLVNRQSQKNMEDLLADKIQEQTVYNQADAAQSEELKNLEEQDLVNEQSKEAMQNMLADKIEKQKVDNRAEAVEREELKDLESQDLVNEQSKQAMQKMLSEKIEKQKVDNKIEGAERQELNELADKDLVNDASKAAMSDLLESRKMPSPSPEEVEEEVKDLEEEDDVAVKEKADSIAVKEKEVVQQEEAINTDSPVVPGESEFDRVHRKLCDLIGPVGKEDLNVGDFEDKFMTAHYVLEELINIPDDDPLPRQVVRECLEKTQGEDIEKWKHVFNEIRSTIIDDINSDPELQDLYNHDELASL